MTVRHVESMIRMAEAHAKMSLRDQVGGATIFVRLDVLHRCARLTVLINDFLGLFIWRIFIGEKVRQDDLDVAIGIMVGSFLAANKLSIVRRLERKFRRFLSNLGDLEELLHHLLNTMVNEQYQYLLFSDPHIQRRRKQSEGDAERLVEYIDVEADEFELKARELDVFSVESFYTGPVFSRAGYSITDKLNKDGSSRRVIVKKM